MNYKDSEKIRAPEVINAIIGGTGNGLFRNKQYPFVLQERVNNLWGEIRDEAVAYFKDNVISWWSDDGNNIPTGHVLSSQVACVNHLFWLRDRKDAALAVIKRISPEFIDVQAMDGGFAEFEVVGMQNYLGESSHQRGANATAFDAAMIGIQKDASRVFIAIEWKYTECYGKTSKYKPARARIYDPLIDEAGSPIQVEDPSSLYYEPYYQLMRQTLLASKIAEAREYGCVDYVHCHVIPKGNVQLLMRNTSPKLEGASLEESWKGVLKSPGKYIIIDPEALLSGTKGPPGTKAVISYLSKRYWDG